MPHTNLQQSVHLKQGTRNSSELVARSRQEAREAPVALLSNPVVGGSACIVRNNINKKYILELLTPNLRWWNHSVVSDSVVKQENV